MNTGRVTGSPQEGERSSSLPRRRTLPPRLETATSVFNEAVRGSGSGRASPSAPSTPTGSRTPTIAFKETSAGEGSGSGGSSPGRPAEIFREGEGSGRSSSPSTPSTSGPSWRGALPNFFSPKIRLGTAHRDLYDKLDRESKQACSGLSHDDLIQYLSFKYEEQQHFNNHTPEDRKKFLLLTEDERADCCTWQNEDKRVLYMKLTAAEKVGYRKYALFLAAKLSMDNERRRIRLGQNKDLLAQYLESSPDEREAIIQKGERLSLVKSALATAKSWSMSKEERAKKFCHSEDLLAPLNQYLETCGKDSEAVQDLGGFMVTSGLLSINNFQSVDDVQNWVRKNLSPDN